MLAIVEWNIIEYWWNDIGRGRPTYSEKTLSQDHFFYHKSHVNQPG
jgi:hypothetical protein